MKRNKSDCQSVGRQSGDGEQPRNTADYVFSELELFLTSSEGMEMEHL